MPVISTNLTVNSSETDATSYATASITLAANKLGLALVGNIRDGGTVATPTITGWTEVATVAGSSGIHRLTLLRRLSSSSSTGALTIDFGGSTQSRAAWIIDEFENVDTGGTNGANAVVQNATNSDEATNTGLTVTLGAFGSTDNATYGGFRTTSNDITPGTGFSELGDTDPTNATALSIETEFKNTNDTSVDASWGSTGQFALGVAVEIKFKAPAGGAALFSL